MSQGGRSSPGGQGDVVQDFFNSQLPKKIGAPDPPGLSLSPLPRLLPTRFTPPPSSSGPTLPSDPPLPAPAGTLLGLLVLSRVGVYIPLEGVDRAAFAEKIAGSGLLGYIDTLAGGSISKARSAVGIGASRR